MHRSIKTIADGLAQRSDNFLLLRFMAASLVIYGHAPAVSPRDLYPDLFVWLNWGEYSGAIAVDIFFIVSGFLVTGSFLRRRHLADFVWARFIRIIPAYAVCLTASALLLGLVFTALPAHEYLHNVAVYRYVWQNLRFTAEALLWNLPGVFTSHPDSAVNGSIWTLPAEVRLYVLVAAAGVLGLLSRRWVFNVFIAAFVAWSILYPDEIPLLAFGGYHRLALLFAAGGFCFVNRAWIPVHWCVLALLVLVAWLCRNTLGYEFLFGACEVAFVFWFAYNTPWRGFNAAGDYSYGIYLWGFPAQQSVVAVLGVLPFLLNALLGFIIALLIAIASWHFIEEPALRLKGLPSRLVQSWRKVSPVLVREE